MILGLFEAYSKQASKVQLAMWIDGVSDLDDSQLAQAIKTAIRTSKFLPSIAEIRELAGGSEGENVNGCAQAAFVELDRLCSKYANAGSEERVSISDPMLAECVARMGGLAALSRIPKRDFSVWTRKEFESIFRQVAEDVRRGSIRPKLSYQRPSSRPAIESEKAAGDLIAGVVRGIDETQEIREAVLP